MNLKFLLLLTLLIPGSADVLYSQQKHDLKVNFTNISVGTGKIFVQLLNPAEEVLQSRVIDAKAGAVVNFESLSSGKYWVRVYQDLNKNSELDMNYFGLWTSGYEGYADFRKQSHRN